MIENGYMGVWRNKYVFVSKIIVDKYMVVVVWIKLNIWLLVIYCV